jgi:hypothetical protein
VLGDLELHGAPVVVSLEDGILSHPTNQSKVLGYAEQPREIHRADQLRIRGNYFAESDSCGNSEARGGHGGREGDGPTWAERE